jgi:hypothetical protein
MQAKLSFVDRPQEWNKEHIGTFKLNSEKMDIIQLKKCGRTANNNC